MPLKNIHPVPNGPLGNLPIGNTLPELPEGPSLERVRAPVEIMLLEIWQSTLLVIATAVILALLLYLFFWRSRKSILENTKPDQYEEAILLNAINQDSTSSELAENLLDVMRLFLKNSLKITISDGSYEAISCELKINNTQSQKLRKFWEMCNHAKFSQVSLDLKARKELIDMAKEIIGELQPTLQEEPR